MAGPPRKSQDHMGTIPISKDHILSCKEIDLNIVGNGNWLLSNKHIWSSVKKYALMVKCYSISIFKHFVHGYNPESIFFSCGTLLIYFWKVWAKSVPSLTFGFFSFLFRETTMYTFLSIKHTHALTCMINNYQTWFSDK